MISDRLVSKDGKHLLVALSLKSPVILVDIKATHMMGQYGFLSQVFAIFHQFRISVDVGRVFCLCCIGSCTASGDCDE